MSQPVKLVRVFSDLHLEFGIDGIIKCLNVCNEFSTKYTILAGDITNFSKSKTILTNFVGAIKPYTENIIYVLGNHEYYESHGKKVDEVKEHYQKLSNELGITLLENNSIETDDFVFYGCTMWTDPSLYAYSSMNDSNWFKSREEVSKLHHESKSKLTNFVNNYLSPKPLVVVTHHLPSFSLIDEQYKIYGDLNTGFASNLDDIIKNPIKYWVYGHTHTPNNRVINGVNLLCNSMGYPKESKRRTFKDLTF